jgi:Zn-finger nucleic acid-binding protein
MRGGNKMNKNRGIVTLSTYQCLCCEHTERVEGKKEDYSEVKVCPKCKGAFVDLWKIHKYQQVSNHNSVQHSDMETTKSNRVIDILKQSKEDLLEHNDVLNRNIQECYKRAEDFTSKADENNLKIIEIENAILRLSEK